MKKKKHKEAKKKMKKMKKFLESHGLEFNDDEATIEGAGSGTSEDEIKVVKGKKVEDISGETSTKS